MDDSNFKLVYYVNYSLPNEDPRKYSVSVREIKEKVIAVNCISPSDFTGYGDCYKTALKDYTEKLDEYINTLLKFRGEIIGTEESYTGVQELYRPDVEGD